MLQKVVMQHSMETASLTTTIMCVYLIRQNLFFTLQLVQAFHQLVHNELFLLLCLRLLQTNSCLIETMQCH